MGSSYWRRKAFGAIIWGQKQDDGGENSLPHDGGMSQLADSFIIGNVEKEML